MTPISERSELKWTHSSRFKKKNLKKCLLSYLYPIYRKTSRPILPILCPDEFFGVPYLVWKFEPNPNASFWVIHYRRFPCIGNKGWKANAKGDMLNDKGLRRRFAPARKMGRWRAKRGADDVQNTHCSQWNTNLSTLYCILYTIYSTYICTYI